MAKCIILSVGRLKIPFWREAADYYRKKLRHTWKVEEIQVRDGDAALGPDERKRQEGVRLLTALPPASSGAVHICLDEYGREISSQDLAGLLQECQMETRVPCFIIGGAYGLSAEVLQRAHRRLSLSKLTFTHELAQALLWEQLYRADSILRNTGYHHE
ncbi:MAG: 23S rRNA (pseudouridine(1915)-N(3))-methyltransferase RlmH [Deltaproteobacteria bacterium]|nr:23S rRNA (pseudouridine(1915)-N(3))-methyltransferase RlmH [Deltaproteobacteria bacterium]